jgi:hypothetical protein
MMSLRREFETLLSEFLPDKEEIRREIEQEWDRMREGGQEIRPGAASKRALLRWASGVGEEFHNILLRRGLLRLSEDEQKYLEEEQ